MSGSVIPPSEIDRQYHSVSAYTTNTYDHVIPSGKCIYLKEMGGSAAHTPDTVSEIIWDPDGANEHLFTTNGDLVQSTNICLVGDGTKKVRITLKNNDSAAHEMGAYYLGEER